MTGAMIDAGLTYRDAAIKSLQANRKAGEYCKATPATKIRQITAAIPEVLKTL